MKPKTSIYPRLFAFESSFLFPESKGKKQQKSDFTTPILVYPEERLINLLKNSTTIINAILLHPSCTPQFTIEAQALVKTITNNLQFTLKESQFLLVKCSVLIGNFLITTLAKENLAYLALHPNLCNLVAIAQKHLLIIGTALGWSKIDTQLKHISKKLISLRNQDQSIIKVITIDGPACTGKSQLADALSWLDYAYLDTGFLYRSVAHYMFRKGWISSDAQQASKAAYETIQQLKEKTHLIEHLIAQRPLRNLHLGIFASKIGVYPPVREILGDFQRQFIKIECKNRKGVILDGRDTGSSIWPDAQVKIFVTADLDVRSRCTSEYIRFYGNDNLSPAEIKTYIHNRDTRDMERKCSPLRMPDDAISLDISNLMRHGQTLDSPVFTSKQMNVPFFVQVVRQRYALLIPDTVYLSNYFWTS